MLDHLTDLDEVVPLIKATPEELLSAQINTADWLAQIGAPTVAEADAAAAAVVAQQAFQSMALAAPSEVQKAALMELKIPAAVRHLTGMLTAYDWEFVTRAQEIRNYAVGKILEETTHPEARIRLRALELLGRVTEVALFTDRVEVRRTEMSDDELTEKIKQKLMRFLPPADSQDVIDITPKELLQ